MKKEKKILIFSLFIFIFILINLFLLSAKDIFGITNNLDPDLAEFLISFIPMAVLLAISYIMIKSRKRGLIAIQLLIWWLFTFYIILKVVAWANIYFNMQLPLTLLEDIIKIPSDNNYYPWFLISLFINLAVGFAMIFKNRSFAKTIT